jgi:hypothetical protein
LDLVTDDGSQIENAFPNANNILPFVTSIEQVAGSNNSQITASFDTPLPFFNQDGLNILKVSYITHLSSNSNNLIGFLQNFEQLPYFTKINSMIINGPASGGINTSADTTINADLYVRDN